MMLTPVSSSNLAAVGYENGVLQIRFQSGRAYAYFDVPEQVYSELMRASSHGSYFNAHIKDVYRYRQIS